MNSGWPLVADGGPVPERIPIPTCHERGSGLIIYYVNATIFFFRILVWSSSHVSHHDVCVVFGVTSWELVVPAAARRAGPGFEQKIQYDTTILYVRR